jgi:hypothetical protein
MTVYVADVHALVQRLVSVVEKATVLEEYTTEEQRSCCYFFCEQKNSMQRIFIKKYFLLTVGSVCRVKRFNLGGNVSLMKSLKRRCGSG